MLFFMPCLGDKNWKIAILHAQFLDLVIKESLDRLPDGVGPWPQDVASRHVIILEHLCLDDDLGIPVGQIVRLPCLHAQPGDLKKTTQPYFQRDKLPELINSIEITIASGTIAIVKRVSQLLNAIYK